MSEKIIEVHPYLTRDNLTIMSVSVQLENVPDIFEVNESNKLNLHNAELSNGKLLTPRKTSQFVMVKVKPTWRNQEAKKEISNLSKTGENPEEVLSLRVRASCPKTFWSSKQESFKMSEVGKRGVDFKILLADVSEQIFIESYIVRDTSASTVEKLRASSVLSIVSSNEEVSIQIDELEIIGGNYLPIKPMELKDLLFRISPGDAYSFPIIWYSSDLEKFFKRDDLVAVNAAFLMIMPSFLEYYLRWLIFTAQVQQTDKEQKSLIDKISKLLGISKDELYEVMESSRERKLEKYLEFSSRLFEDIQTKAGVNFKKELERYITQERKIRSEPI